MTEWQVEIKRTDGMWPTNWRWTVSRRDGPPTFHSDFRMGWAITKERARRKAVRARRSMEYEDVRVIDSPDAEALV